MYALLVHHFVPENRNLRQWLSNDVIPSLRDAKSASVENLPSLSSLNWAGISVPLLHYQYHAWIKWRDMPELMQVQRPFPNRRHLPLKG
ncbi:hypothetical protein D3C86_1499160 [compost metagenome]